MQERKLSETKPTHFAVYFINCRKPECVFYATRKRFLVKEPKESEFVCVKRIPFRYLKQVRKACESAVSDSLYFANKSENGVRIGSIVYEKKQQRFVTDVVEPKAQVNAVFRKNACRGLGSFFEKIAANYLKKRGLAKKISSPEDASPERFHQLRKAGLYDGRLWRKDLTKEEREKMMEEEKQRGLVPVTASVKEWQKGMKRAYRASLPVLKWFYKLKNKLQKKYNK